MSCHQPDSAPSGDRRPRKHCFSPAGFPRRSLPCPAACAAGVDTEGGDRTGPALGPRGPSARCPLLPQPQTHAPDSDSSPRPSPAGSARRSRSTTTTGLMLAGSCGATGGDQALRALRGWAQRRRSSLTTVPPSCHASPAPAPSPSCTRAQAAPGRADGAQRGPATVGRLLALPPLPGTALSDAALTPEAPQATCSRTRPDPGTTAARAAAGARPGAQGKGETGMEKWGGQESARGWGQGRLRATPTGKRRVQWFPIRMRARDGDRHTDESAQGAEAARLLRRVLPRTRRAPDSRGHAHAHVLTCTHTRSHAQPRLR